MMKKIMQWIMAVLLLMAQGAWTEEPIQYIDRWWDEATQSLKEEVKTLDII